MRAFAVVLCAATLAGCATTNMYVDPATDDAAFLTGKWVRNGAFYWESFAVRAIDDKFRSNPFVGTLAELGVSVAPGEHRVLVEATFNRAFGTGGPFQAVVAMPFAFEPKRRYRLNGVVRDGVIEVWYEDESTGQKLSAANAASFHAKPSEGGLVPIFVPRRR